jgi:hypothetical protein
MATFDSSFGLGSESKEFVPSSSSFDQYVRSGFNSGESNQLLLGSMESTRWRPGSEKSSQSSQCSAESTCH